MKRRVIRAGAVVLLAIILGGTIGTLATARREAHNVVHPPRQDLDETPADLALLYQEVTLTTDDGLALRGWYIPGRNGAAIIVQHGYGGTRQGMLPVADMLNERGYAVMLFDWRGHGQSEGDLVTFGVREVYDVRAALEWLRDRPDLDDRRIGALGDSMGAVALLYAAARLPAINAVVAVSAFPSLSSQVEIGVEERAELPAFPFAPLIVWFAEREAGIPISSLDLTRDIGEISPRPVFLLHG
ncbi:MAG: alpha/beta hydrolase, partial [Anaerolineae bacterium]